MNTPRTEEAIVKARKYYQVLYPDAKTRNKPVHAEFARELELELFYLTLEKNGLTKSLELLQQVIELDKLMYKKVSKERDEWRKVADLLAADAGEAAIGIGDSYALTKFKELEKKYPL